jgi:hypothetical protein
VAQRLTLSVDSDLTLGNLRAFLKRADEYAIPSSQPLHYSEDEGTHMLTVPIPDGIVPRRRVVKRKKKEQQIAEAAEQQIAERKEAIKKGEQVPGSVPPVKGVKKAKKKKRATKKTAEKAKE